MTPCLAMAISLAPTDPLAGLADHVSSARLRKLLLTEDSVRKANARAASLATSPRDDLPFFSPTRPPGDRRLVDSMFSPRVQKRILEEEPSTRQPITSHVSHVHVKEAPSPVQMPPLDVGNGCGSARSNGHGSSAHHGGGSGAHHGGSCSAHHGGGSSSGTRFPVLAADAQRRAANRQHLRARLELADSLLQEAQAEDRRRHERRQRERSAKRQQQAEARRLREAHEQEQAAMKLQARCRGVRTRSQVQLEVPDDPVDMLRRRARAALNHNFSCLESYFEYAEAKLKREERETKGRRRFDNIPDGSR